VACDKNLGWINSGKENWKEATAGKTSAIFAYFMVLRIEQHK